MLTLKMVSPDKCGDAADVFRLGSERRRDRCLGFRQRDADVCGSQGPAVVGSVPTHAHSVAAAKQRFPILYCWFKFIVNNRGFQGGNKEGSREEKTKHATEMLCSVISLKVVKFTVI